jgi:hypothetical protein
MTSYLNINASVGIRNNNPYNIKYTSINDWYGQIGVDQLGFAQFDYIENGIRAGFYNLINGYFNAGYNTIESIITRYSETDQQPYIDFVANEMNKSPDDIIIPTPDNLFSLSKAIMEFEVGVTDYNLYINDNMITAGYNALPEQIGGWVKTAPPTVLFASTNTILIVILAAGLIYNL